MLKIYGSLIRSVDLRGVGLILYGHKKPLRMSILGNSSVNENEMSASLFVNNEYIWLYLVHFYPALCRERLIAHL
jgi:hypothetical protein